MFKIYQLYIASSLIIPFAVSTIFFVIFLLTFEMFRVLQFLTARDVGWGFVAEMLWSMATTLVPMALPLSIYFSSIFSMGKLSGDSEYIAMRAMGVSKNKLLLPFAIVGLLASINLFFMGQEIVPNAHRDVREKIKILSSASLIEGIKSGQFFTQIPNVTLFAQEVDDKTRDLKDVFLDIHSADGNVEKIMAAKKGQIVYDKNVDSGRESFKLRLNQGNMTTINKKTGSIEKVLFNQYYFPISEKRFSYVPVTREIMLSLSELREFIKEGPDAAAKRGLRKKDYFNANYEFWNRLNTPLLCFLLTILGFIMGVKGSRHHVKGKNTKSILALITYYILYFSMISVSRDFGIPIYLSLLVPNIALIIYSWKQYHKLDWNS